MRWTDHPHFTGDIWNIHNLRLMYGTYTSNGRCTECSHYVVDVQDMPAPWKMVRTSKTDKAQTSATQVQLELIFLLLLLQPSSKLRKTLISIWRIRILWFHHYGNTPLQPYWAMTLLVTLALPKAMGTLPRCT